MMIAMGKDLEPLGQMQIAKLKRIIAVEDSIIRPIGGQFEDVVCF